MKLIDSHCHLNSEEFKNSYKEIIADCLEKEIGLLNIGADFETSKRAVEIAGEYLDKPIYASIGMHPENLNKKFEQEKFQNLITNKVVAVGEIGLEYYYMKEIEKLKINKLREKQRDLFVAQLSFAVENNLPVILHARGSKENPNDAYEDMLEIISSFVSSSRKRGSHGQEIPDRVGDDKDITGVVHCFSASLEIAQKFLDLGFYLGFTGLITFKNKSIDNLRETVKLIPLEQILVETDAPYLTPEPCRGEINKPQNVALVARKIAELKNITYKEVCTVTTANVKKLFLSKNF